MGAGLRVAQQPTRAVIAAPTALGSQIATRWAATASAPV
jgi:hypothetical protein